MSVEKYFSLLIWLLRLAIADASKQFIGQIERIMPISANDWQSAYQLASKHAVIALAWDGVVCLQSHAPDLLQNLPADLMGKWYADVQTIELVNERHSKQAEQVNAVLRQGGLISHILKGSSFAAYYPNPAHRQSADIDLWVQPMTVNEIPYNLSELRSQLLDYLHSRSISIGHIVYHHIEAKPFKDTELELHVTPTWLCNPIHNSRLQRIFAQTVRLTPEIQELYALLHAFRHIYHDGSALHHILDYYMIAKANRAAGVAVPTAFYEQLGLTSFANAMSESVEFLLRRYDAESLETDFAALSCRAQHLLAVLPARRMSLAVKWDYPAETLCVLPWRMWHFLWRTWHHYL